MNWTKRARIGTPGSISYSYRDVERGPTGNNPGGQNPRSNLVESGLVANDWVYQLVKVRSIEHLNSPLHTARIIEKP